jgi:hypothetical protein
MARYTKAYQLRAGDQMLHGVEGVVTVASTRFVAADTVQVRYTGQPTADGYLFEQVTHLMAGDDVTLVGIAGDTPAKG